MIDVIRRLVLIFIFSQVGSMDAELQSSRELVTLVDSVISDAATFDGGREEILKRLDSGLADIFRAANGDSVVVYRSFALFTFSRKLTEREGHVVMAANGRLRSQFSVSREDMVRAAVPLLESDRLSDREAGLSCLDAASDDGTDRIDPVLPFLKTQVKQGVELSTVLIDYMVQEDPAEALSAMRTLLETKGNRDGELKEFQVFLESSVIFGGGPKVRRGVEPETVRPRLKGMLADPEWWVRLCVAETLRKIPELQDAEALSRIREDEHPAVRASGEAAIRIAGDSTRPPKYRFSIPGLL